MTISGIGNTGYISDKYYLAKIDRKTATHYNQNKVDTYTPSGNFHLRIGENKDAVGATCFPDGSSLSVFKSEEYTKDNPIMIVKYWDKDGKLIESTVNAKEVSPSHANYVEMFALSTYFDMEGLSKDGMSNFMSSYLGNNPPEARAEDYAGLLAKKNFIGQVDEWRKSQKFLGNIAGYDKLSSYYNLLKEWPNS